MNSHTPPGKIPADRVLDALGSSKLVQEAVARADADIAQRRAVVAAEMANLTKGVEATFKGLDKAAAAARTELEAAQRAVVTAQDKYTGALKTRSAESFAFDREHSKRERELRETAHPQIALFIEEMRQVLGRPPQPSILDRSSRRHPVTGRREETTTSNWNAIRAYLVAVREAMGSAGDLQLEADQTGVPERLVRLRATFPSY